MASSNLQFPPLDGSLLFPEIINFHMEKNPTFPIFIYADENVPDTLTEISLLEFGRAAHRVAHALRPSALGADGEVVMIIANTDTILYHAVTTGLSIAGLVPFPASPRNSAAAVVHLMRKTNCSRIVTLDHAHKALVDGVRREYQGTELTIYELPGLHYAFPKLGQEVATDPFTPYPALKRPDPDSTAIYIHSSGSTGFPKPIAHSYRIQNQWFSRSSSIGCIAWPAPRRVAAMALPAFHVFGIVTELYAPVAYLITSVVYPPRTVNDPLAQPVIPTSDNMVECLRKIPCNTLMTVPSLLEQIAVSDDAIDILKKLRSVAFGGGPLPVKIGDKLWDAGVRLVSGYGGTEFGILVGAGHNQDFSAGGWTWMRFADEPKLRWAPQEDDTFELQVLTTESQYMAVENLPDVKGYATSDVFVKHPTMDLWRIVGRADDVIILASGEKTVPAPMESVISSSPLVQGVVMFGRERNQVGILIEPSPAHAVDVNDEKAVAEFRNQIWPAIEEANKPSPAFSRIFKELILITSPDKPMRRAAKGTVQRKATLNAYDAEINALYDTVEASSVAPEGLVGPSAWTKEDLESWLLDHATSISSGGRIDPHADLFAQGFDSLSSTYLRNRIVGALRQSPDPVVREAASHVSPNIIFENPSIDLLSVQIAALVNDNTTEQGQNFVEQHKKVINAMIEKYSVGLNGPDNGILPSSQLVEPAVVLLTGTTGGLGSFLLSELLKSPAVQRVYAYNRPSSKKAIAERQQSTFKDRGLAIDLLNSSKLVYVEADASADKCGLSPAQYDEIRNSVTLIIHNAWRLDFNLAISSFEDSIRATRNLVDLALGSPRRDSVRFLFTSSIASSQSWDKSKGPFPEEVQLDPSVAVGRGYGEGKYTTERIIVKSGLHATSLRIGQIVGGHGGSWATTDWFPIIVQSSVALGVLPDSRGVVSWLREEEVAAAILETAFAKASPPPALNVFNPRGAPWAEIIAHVRRAIIQRKALAEDALPIIPFEDWFELLEKRAESASEDDLVKIPAIKLLEFFRLVVQVELASLGSGVGTVEAAGMATLSTARIQRISPAMANMQAIGQVEAEAWVGYWISKGSF